jgi:3-oxoacyl-[acyl-carrier protein] reductase
MTTYGVTLPGRVALVTGASGWIGAAIARHLAAAGAKVAVHYHQNPEKALKVVNDIEQDGGTAVAISADIVSKDEVQAMIEEIRGLYGPVDILVNNALGRGVPSKPIEEQTWEHYLGHLDFCVKAPLLSARNEGAAVWACHQYRYGSVRSWQSS